MEVNYLIMTILSLINVGLIGGIFDLRKRNTELYYNTRQLKSDLDNLDKQLLYYKGDVKDDFKNLKKEMDKTIIDALANSEQKMNYNFNNLETKFSNQIASGVEVKKALDEIKEVKAKLDEFITTYQNI